MLKRMGFTRTCTLLDSMAANKSGYMTRSKAFTPQIQHDAKNEQFFIDLDVSRAFLSYKKIDKILVMEHTEVPAKLAGKGLGKVLAKFAFDHCVENGLKMQLNCTFLQHYLTKYAPEYSDHVVTETDK